jgi:hypothetical protein
LHVASFAAGTGVPAALAPGPLAALLRAFRSAQKVRELRQAVAHCLSAPCKRGANAGTSTAPGQPRVAPAESGSEYVVAARTDLGFVPIVHDCLDKKREIVKKKGLRA